MAYTFGAGTTDAVAWTGQNNMGNAGIGLVMGWWRPTTLTATRRYWSAGATTGMAVDTTTSELRVTNDSFSGTDGVYTTTGAGITTNSWWFIAAIVSVSNSPTSQWRVWVGSQTARPAEVTINTVSAITTNTNGPTGNFTIGNTSGGSVAFQGDIDQVYMTNIGESASATTHPMGISTLGAVSSAEAQVILERWILPFYEGGMPSPDLFLGATASFSNVWDGRAGAVARQNFHAPASGSADPIAPTYTGVTVAGERAPLPSHRYVDSFSV